MFDLTNTGTKTLEPGPVAGSQQTNSVIVLYLANGRGAFPAAWLAPAGRNSPRRRKTTFAPTRRKKEGKRRKKETFTKRCEQRVGSSVCLRAAPEPFIAPSSPRDFSACHDIDCAIEESLPTVLVLMSPKANWTRDTVRWKTEMFERAREVILTLSVKEHCEYSASSVFGFKETNQKKKTPKKHYLFLLLAPISCGSSASRIAALCDVTESFYTHPRLLEKHPRPGVFCYVVLCCPAL